MPRNLDLTALRSFVAVAETGGVTKAAGFLNLTQSAVSMQLKRLEEGLGMSLLSRSGRTIALTPAGEHLVSYARRMLDLNDEVYARLTEQGYEGEVILGVPHDIVYPAIPQVLRQFAAEYPKVQVHLLSSFTNQLKPQFARGEADIVLTTERDVPPGAETIVELPLVWVGAPGGQAWKRRPLRLAYEKDCIFRKDVQGALDEADIPWEMAVDAESYRTVGAVVSADLAVHTLLEGTAINDVERIRHGGALPDLPGMKVNLYVNPLNRSAVIADLSEMIRHAFARP